MLIGMLWLDAGGAQWGGLTGLYGPWQARYARLAKWRDVGTLKTVLHALFVNAEMESLSLDSTCVKVHGSANGGGKNGG